MSDELTLQIADMENVPCSHCGNRIPREGYALWINEKYVVCRSCLQRAKELAEGPMLDVWKLKDKHGVVYYATEDALISALESLAPCTVEKKEMGMADYFGLPPDRRAKEALNLPVDEDY